MEREQKRMRLVASDPHMRIDESEETSQGAGQAPNFFTYSKFPFM